MRARFLIATLLLIIIGCNKELPEGWIDEERIMIEAAEYWVSLGGNYRFVLMQKMAVCYGVLILLLTVQFLTALPAQPK